MKYYNSFEYIKNMARMTKPALRYEEGEPFDIWQKKAREKLYDLLGLPLEKCDDLFEITGKSTKAAHTQIDFVFQSEEGYFVQGNFCAPLNQTKPLPVVICLSGHGTSKDIHLGVERFPEDKKIIEENSSFCLQALEEGYCSVIIEWRYMGDAGRLEEDWGPLCARRNAALPSLLLGRCAVGERVWDVQRLIDILEKYFTQYADTDKIICMGHSGGGTAAFYSGCVDERIKLTMPGGSVCSFDDSIIDNHHCCCNYVPGIRKYFDMGDLAGLVAPRMLVIVTGVLDEDFPVEGVDKTYSIAKSTYQSLGKEDLCRYVKGDKGHIFYYKDAWKAVHEIFD